MAGAELPCRQGVLALGDSITHGGGGLQRAVAIESWALWVARGLGLPFTGHATDGARLADVVATQLRAMRQRAARPDAEYDVGCLYAGVNDVRRPDWDAAAFGRLYQQALTAMAEHCRTLLTATVPRDLGRPRAVAAVEEANRAIEASAAAHDALVVDLRDLRGRRHVAPDHIHPTAFGQIEIGERALDVLAGAGWTVLARPRDLIAPVPATPWRVLGEELGYAARHARVSARALGIRAVRGLGR